MEWRGSDGVSVELSTDEKCELALELHRRGRLTERQYTVYCLKEEGFTLPEILAGEVTKGKRRTLCYDLSFARSKVADLEKSLKAARAKVEEEITATQEGRPRDGVTVEYGNEAVWKQDKTAMGCVPTSESNWPDPDVLEAIYGRDRR